MNSFIKNKLADYAITNGLGALLARAAREEGREGELSRLEPALVEKLEKSSIITSATASCAIEGIMVPEARVSALAGKSLAPSRREEHEVLNYKNALDSIFNSDPADLRATPQLLKRLHAIAMEGSAHAGAFKARDNEILEKTETGLRLRFTPTPAAKTGQAVEELCRAYNEAINKEEAAPQVCLAALILDFTCIHPFADGNGRVSRLLTTAALLEMGLKMPKMVSLEEIIQNRDHAYYAALEKSSLGWHTGSHDLTPFLRFHLETIAMGYEELQRKIERTKEPVTILFDFTITQSIIDLAFAEFQKVYGRADWARENLLVRGREVTIEGFASTNDSETFERLKHANKLAERCLQAARALEETHSDDSR